VFGAWHLPRSGSCRKKLHEVCGHPSKQSPPRLSMPPTVEIAALRNVVSVIKGGKIYLGKEYDARVRP
jgi:hypothetical protein